MGRGCRLLPCFQGDTYFSKPRKEKKSELPVVHNEIHGDYYTITLEKESRADEVKSFRDDRESYNIIYIFD